MATNEGTLHSYTLRYLVQVDLVILILCGDTVVRTPAQRVVYRELSPTWIKPYNL